MTQPASRPSAAPAQFALRPMRAEDLDRVVEIEAAGQVTPWTRGNFADALAAGYLCMVVAAHEQVVAFGIVLIGAGEAQLLDLGVAPAWRRRGVGRTLLEELLARARLYGARQAWLEVRCSNAGALALYRARGFASVGTRRNYYATADGGQEDGLLMRLPFDEDQPRSGERIGRSHA